MNEPIAGEWRRTAALGPMPSGERREVWELVEGRRTIASWMVTTRRGKRFDVFGLKATKKEQLLARAAYKARMASELFADDADLRRLESCPCCTAPREHSEEFARIYDVPYRRCGQCGHVYVATQPTPEALNRVFREADAYAEEYTNREKADRRMTEIIEPKLAWVRQVYRRYYGREPESLLDVGAGGGHFVAGCRRAGLSADGVEINLSAVRFAREALGVELEQTDFLASDASDTTYDIVTFWGLLEYTPEPSRFIAAARRRLASESGLLIVEVPRADCFATAIQREFSDTIWRHLDPSSHMNLYSDPSLATLLYRGGFALTAAWYFGMDAYELVTQLSMRMDTDNVMARLAPVVAPLQEALDAAVLGDDIVVAAVPTSHQDPVTPAPAGTGTAGQ